MPIDPGLVAAGFLVGLLVGLTGMGGGAVMTPFLISVVGVSPVLAVGTTSFTVRPRKSSAHGCTHAKGPLTSDWRGGSRSAAFQQVLRRSR